MNPLIPKEARYEIKFVAPELEYHRLHHWIYMHTACFVKQYQDRQINNIYFDSHNYNAYTANISGTSNRTKIRYRWYGQSSHPIQGALEIKCKRNFFSWKKIYPINKILHHSDSTWRVLNNNLMELLPAEPKVWLGFHPLAVLINRYQRKYFVTPNGKIRVTLDSNIQVYNQSQKPHPNYSLKENIPCVCVLEIKFPRESKNEVSNIISNIPVRVSRHSKYINGLRSILQF